MTGAPRGQGRRTREKALSNENICRGNKEDFLSEAGLPLPLAWAEGERRASREVLAVGRAAGEPTSPPSRPRSRSSAGGHAPACPQFQDV